MMSFDKTFTKSFFDKKVELEANDYETTELYVNGKYVGYMFTVGGDKVHITLYMENIWRLEVKGLE